MTDRELLELAAKADGIEILFDDCGDCYRVKTFENRIYWNPLRFDGDALRLAVKLKIGMRFAWDGCDDQYDGVWAETGRIHCDEEIGMTPSGARFDEMAATRRAIVRAAAEIGKAMP